MSSNRLWVAKIQSWQGKYSVQSKDQYTGPVEYSASPGGVISGCLALSLRVCTNVPY